MDALRARSAWTAAALVFLGLLPAACGGPPPATEARPDEARSVALDEAWVEEVESWRRERHESLARDDGWLTLIGLHWLSEGANALGSAPGSAVPLPPGKSPPSAGTLVLAEGRVRFEPAEGVPVLLDGEPAGAMELAPDASGEPTVLELGDLLFHVIDRGGRLGVRLKDRRSAALLAFEGMESFPLDPAWRLEARFEVYDPPRRIPIPNVLGTVNEETSWGAAVFTAGGRPLRLDALAEPGAEKLFFVFGDETNGRETYGGGRFLYADGPGADGRLILDFNQAYNPPCVFTPYATCPLPPRQNRLPVRVEAGELTFAGAAVH